MASSSRLPFVPSSNNNSSINKTKEDNLSVKVVSLYTPLTAQSLGWTRGHSDRSSFQSACVISVVTGSSNSAWDQTMSNELVCSQFFSVSETRASFATLSTSSANSTPVRIFSTGSLDSQYMHMKDSDLGWSHSKVNVDTSCFRLTVYDWKVLLPHLDKVLHKHRKPSTCRITAGPQLPRCGSTALHKALQMFRFSSLMH